MTHKILHGLTGALANIHKGEKAMISGAAGGALAEVFAEGLMDAEKTTNEIREENPNIDQMSDSQLFRIFREKTKNEAFVSKFSASLVTGLFGEDVQVSFDAADRAVENNCLPFLFLGVRILIGFTLKEGCKQLAKKAAKEAAKNLAGGSNISYNDTQDKVKEQSENKQKGGGGSGGGDQKGPDEDPEDKSWQKQNKLTEKQRQQLEGKKLEGENPGNVRPDKDEIKVDTEKPGGLDEAKKTFEKLTGEKVPDYVQKPGDTYQVELLNGSEVQIRVEGDSGHAKIDINDIIQRVKEKVALPYLV